jgi:hypothetical protein
MMSNEPIAPAFDHDEREARRPWNMYSILEQVDSVETETHHGGFSENDHASFANRDFIAGLGSNSEIFANCLTPRMEPWTRYAVQEGIGRVKFEDRVRVVRAQSGRPAINNGTCILDWTSKRIRGQEYQQPDRKNLKKAHYLLLEPNASGNQSTSRLCHLYARWNEVSPRCQQGSLGRG